MSQPNRPAAVPAEAEWISYKKMWAMGEKNAQNNRQGAWRWWRADGKLFLEEQYENGNQHGSYKRYFLDGNPAIEGNYNHGKWDGEVHFYRSDSEANSEMPKGYSSNIRKITVRYEDGQKSEMRYFLGDGTVVDAFGRGKHKTIPEAATLDPETNDWQLMEELADDKGVYRQWSSETGKLVLEAHYQGNKLEGSYKKYYKNGDLCKEGEYRNDALVDGTWHYYRCSKEELTIQFAYSESAKIWKKTAVEREEQETLFLYFLKDGTPCNRNGLPIRTDIQVTDLFEGEPAKFLSDGHFATYLQRVFAKQYKALSDETKQARRADFQYYYGIAMPEDLAAYFDAVEAAGQPTLYANLHTALPPFARYRAWEAEGKNIAEQSLLALQRFYPFDDWVDWTAGAISLDALWMERGGHYNFSYQYGLSDGKIYYWQHNQYDSYWGTQYLGVFSPNLSSFLFFNCLCHAHSTEGLLNDVLFARLLELCRPLVAQSAYTISYGYPLQMQTNFWWNNSNGYSDNSIPCYYAFRQQHWWIELLRGAIVEGGVADIPTRRALDASLSHLPDTEDGLTELLNCLWRTIFAYNQANELDPIIARCQASSSVLVKHHAQLARQIQEGRQQLGAAHLPSLRRRF